MISMDFVRWPIFLIAIGLSQATFADYGEGFVVFHCATNKEFEMTRRIIWNEELDALQPQVVNGKGIVKQKDALLFNVLLRKPAVESTCKVSNVNIKIRISNLNTDTDGYTIILFEKEKPIANFISENAGNFWNDEFKIRFTKKHKWEFFCGAEQTAKWEPLPPRPTDDVCSYSASETAPGCFALSPSLNSYPMLRWDCAK